MKCRRCLFFVFFIQTILLPRPASARHALINSLHTNAFSQRLFQNFTMPFYPLTKLPAMVDARPLTFHRRATTQNNFVLQPLTHLTAHKCLFTKAFSKFHYAILLINKLPAMVDARPLTFYRRATTQKRPLFLQPHTQFTRNLIVVLSLFIYFIIYKDACFSIRPALNCVAVFATGKFHPKVTFSV